STTRRPPRSTLVPYTTLFRSRGRQQRLYRVRRREALRRRIADQHGRPPRIEHEGSEVGGIDRHGRLYDGPDAGEVGLVGPVDGLDRKSTRLNSSHVKISYAVF